MLSGIVQKKSVDCLLFICSAIIEHTNQVIYLEDNDVASVSQGMLTIRRMCVNSADHAQSTVREITTLKMQIQQIMKGSFSLSRHYIIVISPCILIVIFRQNWPKFPLYCCLVTVLIFLLPCL